MKKSIYFDQNGFLETMNKEDFAFCNCNRNLECLIAKYRKLKGGE